MIDHNESDYTSKAMYDETFCFHSFIIVISVDDTDDVMHDVDCCDDATMKPGRNYSRVKAFSHCSFVL